MDLVAKNLPFEGGDGCQPFFFWAPKMGIKSIMSQGSHLNHQTYPSWLIHVGNEMLPSMGSMKSPMKYSLKSQVQQVEVKSSCWSR